MWWSEGAITTGADRKSADTRAERTQAGRIRLVFECCQEWNITLSKGKYQVGPVVHFAGYIVSEEGTR